MDGSLQADCTHEQLTSALYSKVCRRCLHGGCHVYMCAGAAGVILLDNEPNGFRVTTKPPTLANLTLATVPQVRRPPYYLDLQSSSRRE